MLRIFFRFSTPRRWLPLAMLCALVTLGGCSLCDWRGTGFSEKPDSGFAPSRFRAPGSGEYFGSSTKAREIERNLGI
jgi:hypothetical protein